MHESNAADVERALASYASPIKVKTSVWFFKTSPGQYGEGDEFIGVTVPEQRKIAKEYRDLPLPHVETLLASPIHEHRLTALLILTYKLERSKPKISQTTAVNKKIDTRMNGRSPVYRFSEIVKFYLAHLDRVNNWDLVDLSAPNILGRWCLEQNDAQKLYTLVRSKDLWKKRVAIVATYAFIKRGELTHTFAISEMLLSDTHDLIHKALGWMLREAGKKDLAALRTFLTAHASVMPRTALRYAIERMGEDERRGWMGTPRVR